MPKLIGLSVGAPAAAWLEAGFALGQLSGSSQTIDLGGVQLSFSTDGSDGITALAFSLPNSEDDGAEPPSSIDGIPTSWHPRSSPDPTEAEVTHPNHVSGIDHVVIQTPDVPRTVAALEAAWFSPRRTRNVPANPGEPSQPARQQVFFWAGEAIIELVGPATPDSDRPASVWGLALRCTDLDAAVRLLSGRITHPKAAVQPGRRIATLDGKRLGLTVPLALLTPHVGATHA